MSTIFDSLPEVVKNEVKSTLSAYSKTYITFSNSKYHESPNICIQSSYAPDHKFIGGN